MPQRRADPGPCVRVSSSHRRSPRRPAGAPRGARRRRAPGRACQVVGGAWVSAHCQPRSRVPPGADAQHAVHLCDERVGALLRRHGPQAPGAGRPGSGAARPARWAAARAGHSGSSGRARAPERPPAARRPADRPRTGWLPPGSAPRCVPSRTPAGRPGVHRVARVRRGGVLPRSWHCELAVRDSRSTLVLTGPPNRFPATSGRPLGGRSTRPTGVTTVTDVRPPSPPTGRPRAAFCRPSSAPTRAGTNRSCSARTGRAASRPSSRFTRPPWARPWAAPGSTRTPPRRRPCSTR